MQRIALHTRLAPGKEEEYEKVHAVIPADLDTALREAGVHTWRIWRDGRDLFHVVEVDDYQQMRAYLRDHPANLQWQARMSGPRDGADDVAGQEMGIQLVCGLTS